MIEVLFKLRRDPTAFGAKARIVFYNAHKCLLLQKNTQANATTRHCEKGIFLLVFFLSSEC